MTQTLQKETEDKRNNGERDSKETWKEIEWASSSTEERAEWYNPRLVAACMRVDPDIRALWWTHQDVEDGHHHTLHETKRHIESTLSPAYWPMDFPS